MLTINADFDKNKYSEYGIGFDALRSFLLCHGSMFDKNLIIFDVDMISSGHVNNR